MRAPIWPDFERARGKRLLVAVSGGADSVALLVLLTEARARLNLQLAVAHVDHSIRGAASREDAAFCRALCERLSVPFHLSVVDVPKLARESGEGIETAARRARYEALRRIQSETKSDWIALAHHRDDQAETVLMHLLRGCGPEGIGGMDELCDDLYRPLLGVPKAQLEDFLREKDFGWRTDATNALPDTPRNALRLHGLPALEESYPQAAAALVRYAESARVEDRLIARLTDEFLQKHQETGAYGSRLIHPEKADEAILRRAIRQIVGVSLNHEKLLEQVRLASQSRGKMEISGSLIAERTPSALYFLPKARILPEAVSLPDEGCIEFGALGTLTISPCEPVPVRDDPFTQVLRRDALKNAVLRLRQSGDRIRPLGCGEKLLSDFLTDRKLDRPLREVLPLVAVGDRIHWAVGVGISEEAKLTGNCDAARLQWLPNDTKDIH